MGAQVATDHRVARLAERQAGVVSFRQLLALGLGRRAIARRVEAGRLIRVHRGVYAVGHRALAPRGLWFAALLAAGDGAVLSHATALGIWDLAAPPKGAVHVTVPSSAGRRRRDGLVVHRSRTLSPDAVTREDGLPLTSVRRTLLDVRPSLSPRRFASVVRQAEIRRYDVGLMVGLEERALDGTEIERRMAGLIRRHGLPAPRRQLVLDAFTLDFFWPGARLNVETDGRATHLVASAFEADRARDARLATLGVQALRFTWTQITREPELVGRTIRAVLVGRGALCTA